MDAPKPKSNYLGKLLLWSFRERNRHISKERQDKILEVAFKLNARRQAKALAATAIATAAAPITVQPESTEPVHQYRIEPERIITGQRPRPGHGAWSPPPPYRVSYECPPKLPWHTAATLPGKRKP